MRGVEELPGATAPARRRSGVGPPVHFAGAAGRPPDPGALVQVLERYFDALRRHDWSALSACLSEDVRRSGPYLDVVEGRAAYVGFLKRVVPQLPNYRLDVSRVRRLEDGAALVELSETTDVEGVSTAFPEALLFEFDAGGRIRSVDVYLKDPSGPALRGDANAR